MSEPLPALARQRLAGWVEMLDVDIDLAQRMLRLPPRSLPPPPIALPAVVDEWSGAELVPALPAPTDDEPEPAPAPVVGLRGAYARRAAARRQNG